MIVAAGVEYVTAEEFAETARAAGVIVAWRKPIARPRRNGFRQECEYVLWGSHGQPLKHAPAVYLPGYVEAAQPRGQQRQHIRQKPVPVLRELVRIAPPDGTVLDPFAGTGSTGVAALAEGRSFLGIEVTEHYAAIARQCVTVEPGAE